MLALGIPTVVYMQSIFVLCDERAPLIFSLPLSLYSSVFVCCQMYHILGLSDMKVRGWNGSPHKLGRSGTRSFSHIALNLWSLFAVVDRRYLLALCFNQLSGGLLLAHVSLDMIAIPILCKKILQTISDEVSLIKRLY